MNTDNISIHEDVRDDLKGRYLTFYIDKTLYGIELTHVIEIIEISSINSEQPITHVPSLPHYMKGIINLRGKVVPVIDVRLKFEQEERPYDDSTCIIVVLIHDMQVGLIVDIVQEVVNVDSDNCNASPDTGKNRNSEHYLSSIAKIGDKVILNIDCEKFFQNDL